MKPPQAKVVNFVLGVVAGVILVLSNDRLNLVLDVSVCQFDDSAQRREKLTKCEFFCLSVHFNNLFHFSDYHSFKNGESSAPPSNMEGA